MDNIEVGAELKRIRKEDLELTQKEFSEKTDIDLKTIARVECGYQKPDELYLLALESFNYNTESLRILIQNHSERTIKWKKIKDLELCEKRFFQLYLTYLNLPGDDGSGEYDSDQALTKAALALNRFNEHMGRDFI